MDENNFFTINVKPAPNPLIALKMVLAGVSQNNPNDPKVNHIQRFIDFAEKDLQRGSLSYLIMSNSGETQSATGLILVNLGTSKKLADELVSELYTNLYEISKVAKPPISEVYFNYTQIPGVWEWWEKGTASEESFGKVHNDKLIGFARVALQ